MSLLLKSLKKADEQNRQPEDSSAAAAVASPPPAAGVAPPSGSVPPPISSGAAGSSPPAGGGSIDFDSIAGADPSKEEIGGGGDERRETVSAARVFRAGEAESGGGGGGRRFIVGTLATLVVVGGIGGVIFSGVIPGVSLGSVLNLLGVSQPVQVVERQDTGPLLEAVSGEDAALSLPRPVVDVQSGIVEFAGFSGDESDDSLDTPQSRRALAEQIRGFVEEAEEGDELLLEEEEDLQIIGLDIDESDLEEEVVTNAVQTAEVSRDRKLQLDSQTPSDRLLFGAIRNNAQEEPILIAQASGAESDGVEGLTGEIESESEAVAESAESDSAKDEDIKVRPSLEGADRRRMLNEAGRLYVGGAYAEAEALYRNVLSANATNIDALRGLALSAVATGRYQLAVATYLKILEFYPNDPVAVADLTNLHGVSGDNFYAIESALKKVIGSRPEWDSRLHFALGNLYAGEERWRDAQKAYFDAYSGEQSNPDYAYNLAVVLDYLNKPELAANYYREALTLAERAPSGFDAAQVRVRISEISQ